MEEGRRDVEVDQRALVKKILARYPTPFPPVRELLQNADDAGATELRVSLELAAEPRDGGEPALRRVSVWNNGRAFTESDWQRVRRIASGNTDEKSIGMFGVGFFTVFALTDAPEIASGGHRMRFFWEGSEQDRTPAEGEPSGKLITEVHALPHHAPGARFELLLHPESGAVRWAMPEELLHLQRMLASTLLFTKSIESIQLALTGQPPLVFERGLERVRAAPCAPPPPAGPPALFALHSKQVEVWTRTIRARSPSGAEAACRMVSGAVAIRANPTAHATKQLRSLAEKLQKQMPSVTQLSLLYDALDATSASGDAEECARLASMLAFIRCGGFASGRGAAGASGEQHGKLHIGLGGTDQTTGAGFHLCGHFLTTMERTSLDFNGAEGFWNRELLAVAGRIARAYFADEERSLSGGLGSLGGQTKIKLLTKPPPKSAGGAPPLAESDKPPLPVDALTPARVRLLCAHTFLRATPNALVGRLLCDAFLAHGGELVLPSTLGPLPAEQLLTVPAALSGALDFVGQLPLVPPTAAAAGCWPFYEELCGRGIIHALDASRLCQHLAERSLQAEQLGRLLRWFVRVRRAKQVDDEAATLFRSAVSIELDDGAKLKLSEISHHPCGPVDLPPSLPLPPQTLPRPIAEQLSENELRDGLGLIPLRFDAWCHFIVRHPCAEEPASARQMLAAISRHARGEAEDTRASVLALLRARRCIPTRRHAEGAAAEAEAEEMALPEEAYIFSAAVEQLAKLRLPVGVGLEAIAREFLEELGLRKHPPVTVVMEGMATLGWSHRELVRYLIEREKSGELHERDWEQLCAGESSGPELYMPTPELRQLELPTIPWKGSGPSDKECAMLSRLRVLAQPPLELLLAKAAGHGASKAVQAHALSYLCAKVASYDYSPDTEYRIVPTGVKDVLARPCECYVEKSPWADAFHSVSLSLVSASARAALQLPHRPPLDAVLAQLTAHPPSEKLASEVFEYMSKRAAELRQEDWAMLGGAKFIPLRRGKAAKGEGGAVEYASPRDVFFASSCKKKFGPLLDYTEYKPSSPAGQFLAKCGVRETPTVAALAECFAANHQRTIDAMGSSSSAYLAALKELSRGLADERGYGHAIRQETRDALMAAPLLIGQHPEGGARKWSAVRGSDCFIGDHPRFVQLFQPLVAPEDAELKELYAYLGARTISEAVRVEYTPAAAAAGSSRVARLVRARVLERACLLLHDIDKPSCPLRANLKPGAEAALRGERLVVCEVESIACELRFNGQSVRESATACVIQRDGVPHVCVVAMEDTRLLLEAVGDVLVSELLKDAKHSDKLVFGLLLASPVEGLRKRGLNVDRFEQEMAFAQQQEREVAAQRILAVARGSIVRGRLRHAARQRLDLQRHAAATRLQAFARRLRSLRAAAALRRAAAAAAATTLQRHARRVLAIARCRRAVAVARAVRVVQRAWGDYLRRRAAREAELGVAELQRRREQWRRAKQLESEERKEAELEQAHAQAVGKQKSKQQLQQEITASLFNASRQAAKADGLVEDQYAAALTKPAQLDEPSLGSAAGGATLSAPLPSQDGVPVAADGAAVKAALAELPEAMHRQAIGDWLYPLVARLPQVADPGRITAMLLDLPADELCVLLASPPMLEARVNEALESLALFEAAAREGGAAAAGPAMPPGLGLCAASAGSRQGGGGAVPPAAESSVPTDDATPDRSAVEAAARPIAREESNSASELSWGEASDSDTEAFPHKFGGGRRKLRRADEAEEEDATAGRAFEYFDNDSSDDHGDAEWNDDEPLLDAGHEAPGVNELQTEPLQSGQRTVADGVPQRQAGVESRLRTAGGATLSSTLTPAMLAAKAETADEAGGAFEEYPASQESDDEEEHALPHRVPELRPAVHAVPDKQEQQLWTPDSRQGSGQEAQKTCQQSHSHSDAGVPHAAPPLPEPAQGAASAWSSPLILQPPLVLQPPQPIGILQHSSSKPPPVPEPPQTFHTPIYGEGAPSAVGLWHPAEPTSAAPPPQLQVAQLQPQLPAVPAEEPSQTHAACAMHAACDGGGAVDVAQLAAAEARAQLAEQRLAEAERKLAFMRDRHEANVVAARETARQLNFVRQNSDNQLGALRQRLLHAETDLEQLLLDPMLSLSSDLARAEDLSRRVNEQLDALEQRRAELTRMELQRELASQQQAASCLAELAASMHGAINKDRPRNAAAALSQLEGEVRAWALKAEAAADEAELSEQRRDAAKSVALLARQSQEEKRAPRASAGLVSRALGDVASDGKGARRRPEGSGERYHAASPEYRPPSGEKGGATAAKGGTSGGKGAGRGKGAASTAAPTARTHRQSGDMWVTLTKPEIDSKLGITLAGTQGPPLVERVAPNGLADGVLAVGDRILKVAEWTVNGHAETTKLLKELQGEIQIRVERQEP
ncbi:hypothetical protein AB1Y20_009143 [Prymnesium parvum]|uniref:Uncharacterized protein n=1 Tax=Prymnesium parvum TaxID=97485 RepID=A0AB34K3C9_PRYPA